jgi:hypothetical protein
MRGHLNPIAGKGKRNISRFVPRTAWRYYRATYHARGSPANILGSFDTRLFGAVFR